MQGQLRLVLLGELDQAIVGSVVGEIGGKLDVDVSLARSLDCVGRLTPVRKQWPADQVIASCLRRHANRDGYVVGLTDRDLCIPNLNFVFGLSERETGTAVVSWHRLLGKDGGLASRIAKEVIHEVGHLKGLEHCKNRECVMWFSNTLEDAFRKKSEFCPSCRFKLGI